MRAGEPWGDPLPSDAVVVDVVGGDADLATAVRAHPDTVLRFVPAAGADFGRALGLPPGGGAGTTVVACDGLDLGPGGPAVNMVVSGRAPDRLRAWHRARPVVVEVDGRVVADGTATTVVVANGQFLRGANLAPRGHPGDGRLEVQVYGLAPAERRSMRSRLPAGDHVPHPRITQASGRVVSVRWRGGAPPLEVDGTPRGPAGVLAVRLDPGAARLLI